MGQIRGMTQGAVLLSGLVVAMAAFDGSGEALPRVTLFKNAGCGCCNRWAARLTEQGFEVVIDSTTGIVNAINTKLGVPDDLQSCHTALVGDYLVVGHVPVDAVLRLLDERPAVEGISVPGMPIGSPGMEVEGQEPESFAVLTFAETGETSVFAEY